MLPASVIKSPANDIMLAVLEKTNINHHYAFQHSHSVACQRQQDDHLLWACRQ